MKINSVVQAIYVLCFFPSTLYFAFPQNEIQPAYLLPCVLILFYKSIKGSMQNKALIYALIISFLYLPLSIISASHLVNYVSYIAPILLFLTLSSSEYQFRLKFFLIIIYLWTAISLHQLLVPANLISDSVEKVLQFFIADRFSFYNISGGVGGRGASGLTGEPSGAAIVIILVVTLLRYYISNSVIKGRKKYFAIMCTLCLCVTNGSGTLVVLLLIYFFSYLLINLRVLVSKQVLLSIMVFFIIVWLASANLLPEIRALQIIWELDDNLEFLKGINIAYALTFFYGSTSL